MREYSTYVPGVGLGYGSISYCKTALERGMSQSLARAAKRRTQQMKVGLNCGLAADTGTLLMIDL